MLVEPLSTRFYLERRSPPTVVGTLRKASERTGGARKTTRMADDKEDKAFEEWLRSREAPVRPNPNSEGKGR